MDIATIAQTLDSLPENKQKEILGLINELQDSKSRVSAQQDFMEFVKEVWPAFIEGGHHQVMADAFNRIAEGSCLVFGQISKS